MEPIAKFIHSLLIVTMCIYVSLNPIKTGSFGTLLRQLSHYAQLHLHKMALFKKNANFGCRCPKITNFIPKWPSLPRLNDGSGFLSVSMKSLWPQYARSTKHSLYCIVINNVYVCSSCFFDIKAVSTRLLTSKGIMYIKASNMVRLFMSNWQPYSQQLKTSPQHTVRSI